MTNKELEEAIVEISTVCKEVQSDPQEYSSELYRSDWVVLNFKLNAVLSVLLEIARRLPEFKEELKQT